MTNIKWKILKEFIPFQVKHHFVNYAKAKAPSFFHFSSFYFSSSLISSITALKWIFIIRHFKFLFFVNSTMFMYAVFFLVYSSLFLYHTHFHLNLLAINLNVFVCNANMSMRTCEICEQDWAIELVEEDGGIEWVWEEVYMLLGIFGVETLSFGTVLGEFFGIFLGSWRVIWTEFPFLNKFQEWKRESPYKNSQNFKKFYSLFHFQTNSRFSPFDLFWNQRI